MPQFNTLKPTQVEYDNDHNALKTQIATLQAQLTALKAATATGRTPGTRIPYGGAVVPASAPAISPSAPSASTSGNSGIIVSDGTTLYPGVQTLIFPGWTITVTGGGISVTADFSGIDDS